jgi:hypothetical protein
MDYDVYLEAYRSAVEAGTRDAEDMATEQEWYVLSSVTQSAMLCLLRGEVARKLVC